MRDPKIAGLPDATFREERLCLPSIRSRIARLFRNVAIPVCFAISFFGGPVWLDIYESASGDSLPPRVPDIMPSNAQNAQAVHEPNSLWVKKVAGVLVPGGVREIPPWNLPLY